MCKNMYLQISSVTIVLSRATCIFNEHQSSYLTNFLSEREKYLKFNHSQILLLLYRLITLKLEPLYLDQTIHQHVYLLNLPLKQFDVSKMDFCGYPQND